MTVRDLKKSPHELSREEFMRIVLSIRASRMVVKVKPRVKKAATKKVKTLINSMSHEEIKEFLKEVGGEE